MPLDDGQDYMHLVPVEDIMVHHYSCKCPCGPRKDPNDDRRWIHNAYDGRDFILEVDDGSEERHYWRLH